MQNGTVVGAASGIDTIMHVTTLHLHGYTKLGNFGSYRPLEREVLITSRYRHTP